MSRFGFTINRHRIKKLSTYETEKYKILKKQYDHKTQSFIYQIMAYY